MDESSDGSDSTSLGSAESTPEQRVISGFWRRLLAFVVDGVILGLAGSLVGAVFFDLLAELGVWGRLLGFSVAFGYFGLLNSAIGRGQTVGKRLMKIEVVDRSGRHITLARSAIRYAILAAPFFLNNAMFPPRVLQSPLSYALGLIVFGLGGAVVYLYVFNRRTRQSLHDLVVGTFVTKRTSKGRVAGVVWRPHVAVVASWLLAVLGISLVMDRVSDQSFFSDLDVVQERIYSTGKVHRATAGVGKRWTTYGDHGGEASFFHSNVVWKTRPGGLESATDEVVSIVLDSYPAVMERDSLAVTVSYGYDIGIAQSWRSQTAQYPPQTWKDKLAER